MAIRSEVELVLKFIRQGDIRGVIGDLERIRSTTNDFYQSIRNVNDANNQSSVSNRAAAQSLQQLETGISDSLRSLEALAKESQTYKAQIASLDKASEDYESSLSSLNKALDKADQNQLQTSRSLATLISFAQTLRSALGQNASAYDETIKRIGRYVDAISGATATEKQSINARLLAGRSFDDMITQIARTIAQLEQYQLAKNDAFKAGDADIVRDIQREIDSLESEVRRLNGELEKALINFVNTSTSVDALTGDLNRLTARWRTLSEEQRKGAAGSAVASAIQDTSEKIREASEAFNVARVEISSSTTTLLGMTERARQLNTALESLSQTDLGGALGQRIASELKATNAEIQKSKEVIDRLTSASREGENAVTSYGTSINDLKAKLTALTNEYNGLSEEQRRAIGADVARQIADTTQDIEKQQAVLAILVGQYQRQGNSVNELQANLRDLESVWRALSAAQRDVEVDELAVEMNRLSLESEEAARKLQLARAELAPMASGASSLENQVRQLDIALNNLSEQELSNGAGDVLVQKWRAATDALKDARQTIDRLKASTEQIDDSSEQYGTSIDELRRKLSDLRSSYNALDRAQRDGLIGREQAGEIRQVAAELQKLQSELRGSAQATQFAEGSYKALSAELNEAKRRFKELSAGQRESSQESAELQRKISRLDSELKKIDSQMGQFNRNVGNYRSALGNVNAVAFGLAATLGNRLFNSLENVFDFLIRDIPRAGIEAVKTFQNLEISLTALEARELVQAPNQINNYAQAVGLAGQAAKQTIDELTDLALFESPFTVEAIAQTFTQARAYGLVGEQLDETTKAITFFAGALQLSDSEVQRIGLALGQVSAKGRLMGEEVRQLTNANVPLVAILEELGFSLDDVRRGVVDADTFIDGFSRIMTRDFKDASEQAALSVAGIQSAFSSLSQISLDSVFAPIFEELTPVLVEARDRLFDMQPAFEALGSGIAAAAGQLVESGPSIDDAAASILALGDAIESIVLIADSLVRITNSMDDLLSLSDDSLPDLNLAEEVAASLARIDEILTSISGNRPKIGEVLSEIGDGAIPIDNTAASIEEASRQLNVALPFLWSYKNAFSAATDGVTDQDVALQRLNASVDIAQSGFRGTVQEWSRAIDSAIAVTGSVEELERGVSELSPGLATGQTRMKLLSDTADRFKSELLSASISTNDLARAQLSLESDFRFANSSVEAQRRSISLLASDAGLSIEQAIKLSRVLTDDMVSAFVTASREGGTTTSIIAAVAQSFDDLPDIVNIILNTNVDEVRADLDALLSSLSGQVGGILGDSSVYQLQRNIDSWVEGASNIAEVATVTSDASKIFTDALKEIDSASSESGGGGRNTAADKARDAVKAAQEALKEEKEALKEANDGLKEAEDALKDAVKESVEAAEERNEIYIEDIQRLNDTFSEQFDLFVEQTEKISKAQKALNEEIAGDNDGNRVKKLTENLDEAKRSYFNLGQELTRYAAFENASVEQRLALLVATSQLTEEEAQLMLQRTLGIRAIEAVARAYLDGAISADEAAEAAKRVQEQIEQGQEITLPEGIDFKEEAVSVSLYADEAAEAAKRVEDSNTALTAAQNALTEAQGAVAAQQAVVTSATNAVAAAQAALTEAQRSGGGGARSLSQANLSLSESFKRVAIEQQLAAADTPEQVANILDLAVAEGVLTEKQAENIERKIAAQTANEELIKSGALLLLSVEDQREALTLLSSGFLSSGELVADLAENLSSDLVNAYINAREAGDDHRTALEKVRDMARETGDVVADEYITELLGIPEEVTTTVRVDGKSEAERAIDELKAKLDGLQDKTLTVTVNTEQGTTVTDATGSGLFENNASGTSYFGGGLTWVGEQGPEIVSLPAGSRIYNNDTSSRIAEEIQRMSGGVGSSTYVTVNNSISQNIDSEATARLAAREIATAINNDAFASDRRSELGI